MMEQKCANIVHGYFNNCAVKVYLDKNKKTNHHRDVVYHHARGKPVSNNTQVPGSHVGIVTA